MKTLARMLGFLAVSAGIIAIQPCPSKGEEQKATEPNTIHMYYPPPESAGGWRRCKNEDEIRKIAGMDPQKLNLLGEKELSLLGGPWGLVIVRKGYLVREWYGVPAMTETTFDVWSCTKSATSIAFGMILEDAKMHRTSTGAQIDLDTPAYSFIPEGYPLTDPRKARIKLRHLLSMTSGIPGEDRGLVGLAVEPGSGEFEIALGLRPNRFGHSAARLFAEPGEGWDYSDAGFAHLSLIFSKVAGMEIGEYMKERVFQRTGIQNFGWDLQGGAGNIGPHSNAHSGLRLSARDFARLGYLMLRHGTWGDMQIVPKWWVDLATRSSQELARSYGYGFWVNTDGSHWPGVPKDAFAFMGYATNRCYVVPSLDLVVVRVGYGPQPIGPVDEPLRSVVDTIIN